jgi:hypothetical protein
VAHRRTLVWLASATALLVGLAMIHVRALRRPEWLMFLALLIAAGALVAPQQALLAAQCSVWGLAIAALAAVWTRLLPGARLAPAPGRAGATPPREGASTQSAIARLQRSSRITSTAPGQAVMEVRP